MSGDSQQLRVGVVGCGPISQAGHFEACRKARNVELYAICDVAPDLLYKMAAIHEPKATYHDYDDMLGDRQVEAVVVAVADAFHVPLCCKAIDAGKHVLVEKPMGVTVEQCEDLASHVEASGLFLQVGCMKRFDQGISFARQFIRDQMGQMLALKAWYCDSTYRYTMTDALQPLPWTSGDARKPEGDPKADLGRYYMLAHGSHLVDTARFLGGPITAVRADLVQKYDAYCWFVQLKFADGSIGHIDLTVAVRMDFHEGFQIYGEHGSVIGKTYMPWYFKTSDVECFSTKDGQYHRPLGADGHFYRRQIEGFADTILHGAATNAATVHDGVAAICAMTAIAQSVRTGQWVELEKATGGP